MDQKSDAGLGIVIGVLGSVIVLLSWKAAEMRSELKNLRHKTDKTQYLNPGVDELR